MSRPRALAVACILALHAPALANAQSAALQERGAQLAQEWCAQCHAIGPEPQPQALADAPSFAELAARPTLNENELAWLLLSPHPVMPQFPITRRDVSAISAYIDSLQ